MGLTEKRVEMRDKNIVRTKTWWHFSESKSECITFTRSQHTFALAKQLPGFSVASVCDFCLRKMCGSVFALRASHVTEWKEQKKNTPKRIHFDFCFDYLFIRVCMIWLYPLLDIFSIVNIRKELQSIIRCSFFRLFFLSFHITDCGYNANESIKAMWEH